MMRDRRINLIDCVDDNNASALLLRSDKLTAGTENLVDRSQVK